MLENDPAGEPPPPVGWAEADKDAKSFWSRVKDAIVPVGDTAPPAEPEPAAERSGPRKPRKADFDEKQKKTGRTTSRRTRLRRAAAEKREGLAVVLGEKVEKIVVERIGPRDEDLAKIAAGFGGMNEVLSDLAGTLSKEDRAQAEALLGIQRELGDQAGTHTRVADSLQGVPDLVSLVRAGSGTFEGQLTTLRDVRRELELQREQRERVVEGVSRLERAMALVAEKIEVQNERALALQEAQARAHAQAIADERARADRALAAASARFEAQVREDQERIRLDRQRAQEEAERFERGMAVMAARVHEQSSAILEGQEQAAQGFRGAQRAIVEGFEDAQARTIEALERLHEERTREQARSAVRSRRVALAVTAAFSAVLGGFGYFFMDGERARAEGEVASERARAEAALDVARHAARSPASSPTEKAVAVAPVSSGSVASPGSGATTLPAGFPR
jgi:hypothetical protein